MSKGLLLIFWRLGWSVAAQAAKVWTPWTTADDEAIEDLRSDEIFEEFWKMLQGTGAVTGNRLSRSALRTKVAAMKSGTPSGPASA